MEFDHPNLHPNRCSTNWHNRCHSHWPGRPRFNQFSRPASNRGNQPIPNWLPRLIRGYRLSRWYHNPLPGTSHLKSPSVLRATNGDPISNRRRTAYRHVKPPARHPRQPAGAAKFCGVGDCTFSTTEGGKKLSRHRATHFPGRVGVVCPACDRVFSRSNTCGDHLRGCNPGLWHAIATTKGTQDSWGERIGQDLVRPS